VTVRVARRLVVEGVVQGVGFRPYVHRLATQHGLTGWVRNAGAGVEALIEGNGSDIDAFLGDLSAAPPPLAQIALLRVGAYPVANLSGFTIGTSQRGSGTQPIPADVGLCDACRRELYDETDRRYRYPFINCTDCGPRYSIVQALPYDRERTTMSGFAMCAACRTEYDDPRSRRFHAEPIACPDCGPRLTIVEENGETTADHAIARARRLLSEGEIVALKGVGGYHLACDARNVHAVDRLRRWKRRGDRPLAIMVRDDAELTRIAHAGESERALLRSPAHPIVLLEGRAGGGIAPAVHPGVATLGVMLPYTPLHQLLIDDVASVTVPPALVMTSANRASDPTIVDDAVARATLLTIAAAVLVHDRPIAARIDDSVSYVAGDIAVLLRRARGYAPLPLPLPFLAPPLLACGADKKNTVCVTAGERAILSPHVGDLGNADVYAEYAALIERLCSLMRIEPEFICHDLHPEYWSRHFAERRFPALPHLEIQHHHAHVASCMAEHGLRGPAIGVAFDGTGFGADGHVWGGEFLIAGYATFERAAHLDYVPMYGGEAAIREPWRMALAYLRAADAGWDERLAPVRALAVHDRPIFEAQANQGFAAPLTSSMGRLFDAVAALIGVRQRISYDGQAAIELEALADPAPATAYDVTLHAGTPLRIDVAPAIRAIVADLDRAVPAPVIAARFHATIAALVVRVCAALRMQSGLRDVVLTGGVFQNRRLLRDAGGALRHAGFSVYTHHAVPAGDGGIAYGQAAVAAARLQGAS
jgi:hydrogenase maturation protein HypF